jgi:hypothetical protein
MRTDISGALVWLVLGVGCPSEPPVSSENQAPSAPDVVIFPADPGATDWLDAVILGDAVDPEGSVVTYRYRWSVGGVAADFLDDSAAVWPEETESGDVWEVSVVGMDDEGQAGPPGTASVAVRGSAPSIRGADLGPLGATFEDSLAVEGLEWEDPDGDPPNFEYAWWIDGRLSDEGGATLPPSAFSEGASVFVALTPVDAQFSGNPVDSNTLLIRGVDPCIGLSFDGVDDAVRVGGEALPVLGDIAVEAWIRPVGSGVVASTREDASGWELAIDAAGQVLFWVGGDTVTGAALPEDGAFHHVAATRNAATGEVIVFVDGQPADASTTADPGEGGPLLLGVRGGAQPDPFEGTLDDLRISFVPRYRDAFVPRIWWPVDSSTLAVWHWSEGAGETSADQAGDRVARLDGPSWSTSLSACAR